MRDGITTPQLNLNISANLLVPHHLLYHNMANTASCLTTLLLLGSFALAASVPSSTEMLISARHPAPDYVRPDRVGICGRNFVQNIIEPTIRCSCQLLFKGLIRANVQSKGEQNCLSFFGSVETILAIESPCGAFMNSDGSYKKKKIQSKVQGFRDICFPDTDITVIIY